MENQTKQVGTLSGKDVLVTSYDKENITKIKIGELEIIILKNKKEETIITTDNYESHLTLVNTLGKNDFRFY